MKKIFSATLITLLSANMLLASPESHKKLSLVSSLPYPMKAIMNNVDSLKITDIQLDSLSEVLESTPKKMHDMFDEVEIMEKDLQKAVMKEHQTKEQLKSKLDAIAKLKREITETQIDTLNRLHSILNQQQIKQLYKILKEQKNKQHKK